MRFRLDESLDPKVAEALVLVGYDFTVGRKGDEDPEIIEWCRRNQAVWVHADDRARSQHRLRLEASGIRTIWLYRKRGRMTGREQLRILAYVLPHFFKQQRDRPREHHVRASASDEFSKPSLRPYRL